MVNDLSWPRSRFAFEFNREELADGAISTLFATWRIEEVNA